MNFRQIIAQTMMRKARWVTPFYKRSKTWEGFRERQKFTLVAKT